MFPPFVSETGEFVDRLPQVADDLQADIADLLGTQPHQVGDKIQDFVRGYTDQPESLLAPLALIGISAVGVLAALVLMLITAYYMAVRPQPLVDGITSLFPPRRREWAGEVMDRLRRSWIGWMQGVLVDMAVTGVLLYAGLRIIGLDFAIFFAVFSALLVVIPYFGSIAGAIRPTAFALPDSPEKATLTLGIYILVQRVESNLTIPIVMAQRIKLHPALIAVGVVVIGQLFGFIGLFVAVPILSAIVILVDELWVKPLEAEQGVRPAAEAELSGTGAALPEREPAGVA